MDYTLVRKTYFLISHAERATVFNLGFSEIILISIIALIFIGPKQLPEIARALGRALNELKRASEDLTSTITNPKNFTKPEVKPIIEEPSVKIETTSTSNTEPDKKEETHS